MTEKNERKSHPAVVRPAVDEADVINHRLPATFVEIAEVLDRPDAFAVSAMIVNNHCIPLRREKFHERNVPFFVLAHSVHNLEHGLRSDAVNTSQYGYFQSV